MAPRAHRAYNSSPLSHTELDLSACDNIRHIVFEDLLHSYSSSLYFRDSLSKPQFEHVLSTLRSPALREITVRVENHIWLEEDEKVSLLNGDWRGVDPLLCDLLVRVRTRSRDPLWTFGMRIMGCLSHGGYNPADVEKFLPDFQSMGGVVVFLTSYD